MNSNTGRERMQSARGDGSLGGAEGVEVDVAGEECAKISEVHASAAAN
jgi:hypothetical protein